MPRTAQELLPSTLTFLIEEQRVCEAEALVHLMAPGHGTASWTAVAADAWRAHLREHVGDFGAFPLFPLLYVRNSQIPRAIRAFEQEVAAGTHTALQQMELFLEMLRLFALKRRVPLAAFTTKLKRDRVGLITAERFAIHRDQLFAAGARFLRTHLDLQPLVQRAVDPDWVVYPLIRDFLTGLGDELRDAAALPEWWSAIALRLAVYSDDREAIEALLPALVSAPLSAEEKAILTGRLQKRIARLAVLAQREGERKRHETEYLDSVRVEWFATLEALPILERSPHAWEEYQDFRDRQTPAAVGSADELLLALPREATYTVWEVGAILPFMPVKNIRLRPMKTRVRRVNPDEQQTWACPGLEHYVVEEGIRRPIVTQYIVLRLRDQAYALFNLTPSQDASAS